MNPPKNILLTGASGFIGRHFCRAAIDKGYAVYAVVRSSSPEKAELEKWGARLLTADITRADELRMLFEKLAEENTRLDVIVHAAGLTKARKREDFIQVNYTGTQNMVDACLRAGNIPGKIIYLSSLAACGPELYGQTITDNRQQPVTHYGESKLQAEKLLRTCNQIPHIILRPTAVYGPGEKDLLTVFRLVSRGINPVIGFHPQQLTFVYVSDLVEIMLAAVTSDQVNRTYFVTDGHLYDKYSLGREIATTLQRKPFFLKIPAPLAKSIALVSQFFAVLSNKQTALNLQKHKELVAGSWNCNAQRTFDELQYRPAYDLQKGVSETIQWYKTHQWIR